MDPEVRKMAATSFKIMNPQKGILTTKVNHDKYVSSERFVRKPTTVSLNGESIKVEDKTIHANGFRTTEQDAMIEVSVRQQKELYNNTELTSNSKDYRKRLTLTSPMESKTRLSSEVENKRQRGPTYILGSQERNAVLYGQGEGKHRSETSTRIKYIKEEPLFQDVEDTCSQDVGLQHEVRFNDFNMKGKLKTEAPHHIDMYKRKMLRDDVKSGQKIFDQRQPPREQMPTVSGVRTYSNKTKPETLGIQKDKSRSSLPGDLKQEVVDVNEKDKSPGSSIRRKFLLIDSQGLPYHVVIEEPKLIGSSNSSLWSDGTPLGVTKSLAPRKVYKCPVCSRIFEYLSYLQRHSIAHSQHKPHVCKVCGKAFKRTSHLTRHKYTHVGVKSCHCEVCHLRFRDPGELARHRQSHAEEEIIDISSE